MNRSKFVLFLNVGKSKERKTSIFKLEQKKSCKCMDISIYHVVPGHLANGEEEQQSWLI